MKKAKLLLLIIAIISLAGGTYAFKLQRVGKFVYLREAGETTCSLLFTEASFLPVMAGQGTIGFTTATLVKGNCTAVHSIYTAP